MKFPHCSMALAKLSLKGKYTPEDLDRAEELLYVKGYIAFCENAAQAGHEDCVAIVRGERA